MSIWNLSTSAEKDAAVLRSYLHKPPLMGGAKKICTLIEKLSASCEPAALPSVASGLFSSHEEIHEAAASGVAKLLALVPSIELIRLNEFLGGYYLGYVSERWSRITPKKAAAFLSKTGDVAVGNLLSLHNNGYVRHVSVKFLSAVESGEEIRFLLLRQNDWVDPIATCAQAAIRDRLNDDQLSSFANESDLLMHLLRCRRKDQTATVSMFLDLLIEPRHREDLFVAVNSCGRQNRRNFIEVLLRRDGDHLADIVRDGLSSEDEIIRSKCLRRAIDCLPPKECVEHASNLLSDKFIPVRLRAYELLAESSPTSRTEIWRQGLFDKSRSMRETAAFFLKKDKRDVAAIYRQRLACFPNSLPALSGLAAYGDETDLELFSRHLTSPYASRRVEAIRGIGSVGNESHIASIQKFLLDESTRVVRMAEQQISNHRDRIDPEYLFGLIEDCKNSAGKKAILNLLIDLGRWRAMSFLIRATANQDALVSKYSKKLIDSSFAMNRVFTQPSFSVFSVAVRCQF